MVWMVGQCSSNVVPPPGNTGGGSTGGNTGGIIGGDTGGVVPEVGAGGSGLNEEVPFSNVESITVQWNSTRRSRFGTHGSFAVYALDDAGVIRGVSVQIVPDNLTAPSSYTIYVDGKTGVIVIT